MAAAWSFWTFVTIILCFPGKLTQRVPSMNCYVARICCAYAHALCTRNTIRKPLGTCNGQALMTWICSGGNQHGEYQGCIYSSICHTQRYQYKHFLQVASYRFRVVGSARGQNPTNSLYSNYILIYILIHILIHILFVFSLYPNRFLGLKLTRFNGFYGFS